MTTARVRLHVASQGNEFMVHIATLFAEGLAHSGVDAKVVVDRCPLEGNDEMSVIVAPHEYFPLYFLKTRPTIELQPTLEAVAVLNVEQPGSEWFEVAWEFGRRARRVFDISPTGVAEFGRRGVTAIHTPLGFTPSLEAAVLRPAGERPIDVLFFGHASGRRNAFFARHADLFSGMNSHIVLTELHRPRSPSTPGYRSGADRLQLVADSKIVLSVHSADRPYFEQHRAMLAMANHCLLVAETSRSTAPLEPGVHFVSADLDELPQLCRRYLDDPESLERIASAGANAARTALPISRSCAVMLQSLGSPDTTPAPSNDHSGRLAVRDRLRDSLARQAAGDAVWSVATNTAYSTSSTPAVSVLITLFNYEQYIARCLESVLAAATPAGGLEIVVVDDASSDSGPDIVTQAMAVTGTPIALVRKSSNSGLADARNVGLKLARGRHVFMLDADNWVYPSCLVTLQSSIQRGDYAAAYGHIARIEEETGDGLGLVSSLDWNPRRLVEGPYIDAMALVDRQAVLGVGGYSTELIDYGWFGWEDYDLWLKLAQAGKSCCHVPRIVAGYRDHGSSMLRCTNQSSERLAAYFTTKFAALVRDHAGLDRHFAFPASEPDRLSPEQAEIQRLRTHVEALERQLADVYASKSWRMTAPLRGLQGLMAKTRK